MKFLVLVLSLVASLEAVPLDNGYGEPVAPPVVVTPVETVTLPEAPTGPVVEVVPQVRFLPRIAPVVPPFAPTPLSPAPIVSRLAPAPLAVPTPHLAPAPVAVAPVAPRLAPAPVAVAPVAPRLAPAPVAVAPVAPRLAPAPLAVAPVAPRLAPVPLAADPRLAPLPPLSPIVPSPLLPSPFPAGAPRVAPFPPTPLTPFARFAPFVPPPPPSTQFHAQDEFGGFSFGYQNVDSGRHEVRTPEGLTSGSYSYIDANGVPQTVDYVADPINGFRVTATNLPVAPAAVPAEVAENPVAVVDTPEVAEAKIQFQRAFEEALARNAQEEAAALAEEVQESVVDARRKRSAEGDYEAPAAPVVVVPAPSPLFVAPAVRQVVPIAPVIPGPLRVIPQAAAPVLPVATAPLVPVAPAVIPAPVSTQYNAQDEIGGVSFGYSNINSAREETRTPEGITTGSYSYVDANGITQTVNYIADALGFRVAGTNLPVAPVA